MVRGAARGITVPTNLPAVWNSLQQLLQDIDGANGVSVEGAFFQSLFNGLLKEGEILGALRAGVQWTPAVSLFLFPVNLLFSLLHLFLIHINFFLNFRFLPMLKGKVWILSFHRFEASAVIAFLFIYLPIILCVMWATSSFFRVTHSRFF